MSPGKLIAQKRLARARLEAGSAMVLLDLSAGYMRHLLYGASLSFKALELSEDVTALVRQIDLLIRSGDAVLDHEPTAAEMREIDQ